jgi:hypothetical protein
MEQEEDFIRAFVFSRKWEINELEMLFTEANEDVTLVTFSYTGEAAEYVREEEFVVPADGVQFTYTFEEDEEEWIAGFADLPADYDPGIYELDSDWRELPDDLGGHGIYMQGHNRSDDLFMFLKRQVDGLDPGAAYQATFRLVLANNVPEGMSGIGGSPGESVFVKVGATTVEPDIEEDADGWLRMNIDKGNQAQEGQDMINIGDLANPNIAPETAGAYELMGQNSSGRDFEVTADENGVVWFIVGTDSGFEGLTTLYYDTISGPKAQTYPCVILSHRPVAAQVPEWVAAPGRDSSPHGVGAGGARGHGLRRHRRGAARVRAVRRPAGAAGLRHLRHLAAPERRTQLHRGRAILQRRRRFGSRRQR